MATIAPYGKYYGVDDNGNPLSGGKLYTYEAGTSTPKATFTTATGDVPNTNPVILDASGLANVWLGDGGYKFVLTDSEDNTIFTTDNIGGASDAAFGGQVNEINTNTNITNVYANSANIVTGTTTLSLLPVSEAGEGFYISVKNYGVGNVTIDPDAGETIDGSATKVLLPSQSCLVICSGTAWFSLFVGLSGADNINFTGNNTFTGTNSFSNDTTFTGKVKTPDDGELTIASGVITVTGVYHTVDTEGDAATDDLVTINGGTDGQILVLRTESDARDVVLKSTGNIDLVADVTLGSTDSPIELIYDGTAVKWLQRAATASQGSKADTALQTVPSNYLRYADSGEQALVAASGTGTWTHGLGVTPKISGAYLICKTADLGYAVGDMLPAYICFSGAGNAQGVFIYHNATQVRGVVSVNGYLAGTTLITTLGNWRIIYWAEY